MQAGDNYEQGPQVAKKGTCTLKLSKKCHLELGYLRKGHFFEKKRKKEKKKNLACNSWTLTQSRLGVGMCHYLWVMR